MADVLEQALDTFVNESLELLQAMETALQQLESEPENDEALNSVFRAAHTIKGSAGMFGMDDIVDFTHTVESVLERLRAGEIPVTPELIRIFLACRDHTERLLEQLSLADETVSTNSKSNGQALLKELQTCVEGLGQGEEKNITHQERAADTPPPERQDSTSVANGNWHISLRLHPEVLRNGLDPLSFLRYLTTFGEIRQVEVLTEALPCADKMDPELCYLGFEVVYCSDTDEQTLSSVFEFLAEESSVIMLSPHCLVQQYADLIKARQQSDDLDLGVLLVRNGILSEQELELTRNGGQPTPPASQPSQELPPPQANPSTAIPEPAAPRQAVSQPAHKPKYNRSIRVDAERLDQLIDLVGELVIAGAGNNLLAQTIGDNDLLEAASQVTRLVEEIRDQSLSLRMVQVGDTFNRFNRVVRDLARELDKDIKLVIEGGDTELDKSMAEKINDPLTHLIRNAIDHGIEAPEIRQAHGKPSQGTVRLDAYHDSGSIVIEVSDDGGGIDPDKVLAKAKANELISSGQSLDMQDIYRLILEPGFSTKEEVSNLSGRGVGMDVVKRNVDALRGSIEVDSQLGAGSIFRIRLPLTLSIIDGFLVGVGDSVYVIPLDVVVECIEDTQSIQNLNHHGDYINLRSEVLPYLNLRELFKVESPAPPRTNIIVVQYGKQKAGLIVDALLGEHQTVIKPLSKVFARLSGISGSTILGNGEVAMILDIASLVQQAEQDNSS